MTAFEKESDIERANAENLSNESKTSPSASSQASSTYIKRLIGLEEPAPPLPSKPTTKRDFDAPKPGSRSLPSGSKLSKASDHVMKKGSRLLQSTTASRGKEKTPPIYKDRVNSSSFSTTHRRFSTGSIDSDTDSEFQQDAAAGKYQKREVTTPPKGRPVQQSVQSLDRFEDAKTTIKSRRKSLDGALGSAKAKSSLSDTDSKPLTFVDRSEERKTSRISHGIISSSSSSSFTSKARPKAPSTPSTNSTQPKPTNEPKQSKSKVLSSKISPSRIRHFSSSSSHASDQDHSDKPGFRVSKRQDPVEDLHSVSESDTENDFSSIESSPLHAKTMTDLDACRDLCDSGIEHSSNIPSVRKLVNVKSQKADVRKLGVEKGNKVPLVVEGEEGTARGTDGTTDAISSTNHANGPTPDGGIASKTRNKSSDSFLEDDGFAENFKPNGNSNHFGSSGGGSSVRTDSAASGSRSNGSSRGKTSSKEEHAWVGNDVIFSPVSTLDLILAEESMDSPQPAKKSGLLSSTDKENAMNELTIKISRPDAFSALDLRGTEENDLRGIMQCLSESPSKYSSTESYESLEFGTLDFIGEIEGMEKDLEYVRHILIISGFASEHSCPSWYSPSFPLNPALFEQLEQELKMGSGESTAVDNSVEVRRRAERHQRMLLFDAVNEALRLRLLPYLEQPPWIKLSKPLVRTRPVGKELLQEVWGEIHSWPVSASDEVYDILDDAARRDMTRGVDKWDELGLEEGHVLFQVEEMLFNDLIEEVIYAFTGIEMQRNKKRYPEGAGLSNVNRRSSVVDVSALMATNKEESGLKWVAKLSANV